MPIRRKSDGVEGTTDHDDEFWKDLLRGADEIAQFLFGGREQRRAVYHLVATSNIPVFKLGSMLCARRSVLLKWVRDQEDRRAGLQARSETNDRVDPRRPGPGHTRQR